MSPFEVISFLKHSKMSLSTICKCSSFHFTCFIFLCFLLNLTLVNSSPCVHEGCDCNFRSGKKFSSCVGLNLNKLPQCNNLSPDDINSLQDIQAINLTQNYFPELPANFFHKACLDNLQRIYIQQVGLKNVHDKAFHPMKNIIELFFSLNSLRKVPSRAIESLSNLRLLDLSFNNIDHLSNNSFRDLANLQTLFLNNNELSFIDIEAFKGLTKIQIIKLNSNRLTTLKAESFTLLKGLHTLYLESNYWNCNCKMQPFKRMLLLKETIRIHDNPKCISNSMPWNNLDLENFQCAPKILHNFSDTDVTASEGSTLRLKCAIIIETFGEGSLDEEYLSFSHINWRWNEVLIKNNSKGCNQDCKQFGNSDNSQQFVLDEYVREYENRLKIKISILKLYSVMTLNEGKYICEASNSQGKDELAYGVHIVPFNNNNFIESNKIAPAASSDSQISSFIKNKSDANESSDHILFGLVLGILCGIFIVLVIFSIILVAFFRKHKVASHQPHELVTVDASTDNNTVDENHDTNTETTEKLNVSQAEFNPLLVVNPVQKPPRLGIPDVSSIYSNPSWTMDRANYNRSRYASYAETEPLYSDYYTLYRPNRQMSRLDNRTFISDTASEV